MRTVDIDQASKPLSDYVKEIAEGTLVLMSKGKPLAALVSLQNVDLESLALSTSPEFLEIIEESRKEFQAGQRFTLEDLRRESEAMR